MRMSVSMGNFNLTKKNSVKLKIHFLVFLYQIVVLVDAVTCIICGICVFSTMGNLALEQGKSVDDVIADGPGLVFVVFPHALSKMPFPQLWSATFFFMLILLGIDSQVNKYIYTKFIRSHRYHIEYVV